MEYIEHVSGTNIEIENSNGDKLLTFIINGNLEQQLTPTPSDPQNINVVTDNSNIITISDGTNNNEYTIYLGDIELCKINDITDSIQLIDNKWCLTKQIGKLVLNGSENWQFYGDSSWKFRLNINDIQPFTNDTYNAPNTVICNHFSATNWNNTNNNGMFTGMQDINQTLSFAYNDMATLADFKSWLLDNNVTIYYVLNSPIISEITNELLINELNSLMRTHLPYGVVNIKWEGDLPTTLDITYNNWNKYINPSDRQALLNGTATIETKIMLSNAHPNLPFEQLGFQEHSRLVETYNIVSIEPNHAYSVDVSKAMSDNVDTIRMSVVYLKDTPHNMDELMTWLTNYIQGLDSSKVISAGTYNSPIIEITSPNDSQVMCLIIDLFIKNSTGGGGVLE